MRGPCQASPSGRPENAKQKSHTKKMLGPLQGLRGPLGPRHTAAEAPGPCNPRGHLTNCRNLGRQRNLERNKVGWCLRKQGVRK